MTDINLTASPGTPAVNGLRIASLIALLGAAAFVMRHQASDRLPSLIRGLRLAGLKAILCGVFLVLASFAASAQSEDCPVYPPLHDQPDSEIVGTDCYIGHDEPIVSFYSNAPGSASNMTWEMVLPTEKTATPNTYNSNTPDPTQSYQLYHDFQIYLVLCDPNGTGDGTGSPPIPLAGKIAQCTPNNDTNDPTVGSALLELKFIPPGEPLGTGNGTCSNRTTTQWCSIAQIQIDNTCPGSPHLNEAWITTTGLPPQPVYRFTETQPAPDDTFLMNQGDRIRVMLTDSENGLLIVIVDETTNTTGSVQTSAVNGFGSIDPVTCTESAFTFRPLWNTACGPVACNGVPHGYTPFSHYLNVAWGTEIGHSEARGSPGADTCRMTTNIPSGVWCFTVGPDGRGDSDVDGPSFQAAAWPPSDNGPGSAAQIISPTGVGFGPTTSNLLYEHIRFTAGSGRGGADANAADFYPYYSLLQPGVYNSAIPCALVLGNFVKDSNNSINDFGQSDQYGMKPNRGQLQPVIPRPSCGGECVTQTGTGTTYTLTGGGTQTVSGDINGQTITVTGNGTLALGHDANGAHITVNSLCVKITLAHDFNNGVFTDQSTPPDKNYVLIANSSNGATFSGGAEGPGGVFSIGHDANGASFTFVSK